MLALYKSDYYYYYYFEKLNIFFTVKLLNAICWNAVSHCYLCFSCCRSA